MIKILVPGDPVAKKRPRFFRKGGHVGTYSDQHAEANWFRAVALAQIGYPKRALFPLTAPLRLEVRYFFRFPRSWPKKKVASNPPHLSRPDVDNCLKFTKDCLNGAVWSDDRQIVSVTATKAYSEEPRTEIFVSYSTAYSPFNKERAQCQILHMHE